MSISSECGGLLQTLTGHTSDVTSCDFTPNYTLITGSSDKTVRVWEWMNGDGFVEKACLKAHKYGVTCVRVSPQGSMLATASIDGTAILWNVRVLRKIYTMVQVNGDAIRVCRFAPDSSVLVTGGDNGAICVWDLVHRNLIRTIFYHEGTTQGLTITPDSLFLISACSLEMIHVWYLHDLLNTTNDDDNQCIPTCSVDNAHDMGVLCLDVSNNIRIDEEDPFTKRYTMASSGNSDKIKLWEITTMLVPSKLRRNPDFVRIAHTSSLDGHSSAVTCVQYSNSGLNLISASLDKLVKIWDANGACLLTLRAHTRYINCVTFSRDFTLAASGSTGSNDKSILIWSLNGKLSLEGELTKPHMQLMGVTANGIREEHVVVTAESSDNTVELVEKIDEIFEGAINSCCFHDDLLVATGSSDKLVRLFQVNDEGTLEEMTCSPLEGHSYPVNHVEFSKQGSLATCSLDGLVNIWNPMTGERVNSLPENRLGIRVCKFSPDGRLLLTAGDDEIGRIWNVQTMECIGLLEGHSDAITCTCFSPDGLIVATTSSNGDFRLWTLDERLICIQDDAHDLGILSCDFSENLEPAPIIDHIDYQNYLLATSGNDSLVKLWIISLRRVGVDLIYDNANIKLWRTLQGHGGCVFCVRFSLGSGEFVCSTATDRQARIWSVFSAQCLHVLEHDSIVTSCAFNRTCSLLTVGCFDKTLWMWRLPQELIFQTIVANKLRSTTSKTLADWSVNDVLKWLKDIGFAIDEGRIVDVGLNGERIIAVPAEEICEELGLDEERCMKLMNELKWLKQDEQYFNSNYWNKINDIPDEYICPITQEIMREPVTISDGFTYEKRAITEWFMSGKFTSPMTNATLDNTDHALNHQLRNDIHQFLYGDGV